MLNLDGKIALITGATGGLGKSISIKMHKQGAHVVISGTRVERLESLKDELKDKVTILPCNLNDFDDVSSLISKAEKEVGHIDILVNNAGLTSDGLAVRMKENDWDNVMNVNLKAAFKLSQDVLKGMMKRRYGRIINITSVVATTGNPGQANYCASKAGMIGMSKSMAIEVGSRGITVNSIAPGFIESDMTNALNEKQCASILSRIPQGKIGNPEDIANAVVYLSSDEASYITGQTLHINGGMLMV